MDFSRVNFLGQPLKIVNELSDQLGRANVYCYNIQNYFSNKLQFFKNIMSIFYPANHKTVVRFVSSLNDRQSMLSRRDDFIKTKLLEKKKKTN